MENANRHLERSTATVITSTAPAGVISSATPEGVISSEARNRVNVRAMPIETDRMIVVTVTISHCASLRS